MSALPDSTTTERRITSGSSYGSAHLLNAERPISSIQISLEFLRGVEAAVDSTIAEEGLLELERFDLYNEVLATEVARLREEATK